MKLLMSFAFALTLCGLCLTQYQLTRGGLNAFGLQTAVRVALPATCFMVAAAQIFMFMRRGWCCKVALLTCYGLLLVVALGSLVFAGAHPAVHFCIDHPELCSSRLECPQAVDTGRYSSLLYTTAFVFTLVIAVTSKQGCAPQAVLKTKPSRVGAAPDKSHASVFSPETERDECPMRLQSIDSPHARPRETGEEC